MLEGYAWAAAHRPGATFDYCTELPACAWVGVEADSAPLYAPEWADRLRGRPLLLSLGVDAQRAPAAAWRQYCTATRDRLRDIGLADQLLGVQISEELYLWAQAGRFDAALGGLPWPAKAHALRGWLDSTAIPIAREVFATKVHVVEPWWSEDIGTGLDYRPVPRSADVIGIDPYIPAWALRTGLSRKAWEWFTERPIREALAYGKPVHVIGQSFRAEAQEDLWGEMPPPEVLAWTRALALAEPLVSYLSWFCWGSMPGVVGARDVASARDAITGDAR